LTIPLPLQGDAHSYDTFARSFAATGSLLDFDGQPLTYRPPGYPLFVGLTYAVSGNSPIAVTLVQALIDTAVVLGLFLFLRVRLGPRVALVAALLYGVSLSAIFSVGSELSEAIGTAMLLGATALTVLAAERDRLTFVALAGLVCSALTLTRSVMVFFPLVLGASLLFVALPFTRRLTLAGVLCIAYSGGLVPWLIRNLQVIGAPKLSTNAGDTLYASWVHPPGQLWGNNVTDAITAQAKNLSAVESDKFLFAKAVEHIKEDPARAAKLVPEKIALLLAPWDYEIVGRGRQRSWKLHWPVIALLAAFALRQREVRRSQLGVIAVLGFASLLATSIAFYGSPRFRVPFEALLIIPAAVAAERVLRRVPSLRSPPASQESAS
jgi:hypothetical protein